MIEIGTLGAEKGSLVAQESEQKKVSAALPATIGLAAVQTAIEYEYRFTEYRPPRRTEYEYDEIRCEARTIV
jgi:hypothetical protein